MKLMAIDLMEEELESHYDGDIHLCEARINNLNNAITELLSLQSKNVDIESTKSCNECMYEKGMWDICKSCIRTELRIDNYQRIAQ